MYRKEKRPEEKGENGREERNPRGPTSYEPNVLATAIQVHVTLIVQPWDM